MTIRVPTAGNNAGRAADIPVRTPQGAGMIAQVAELGAKISMSVEEERLAREAQDAELGFTKDLHAARLAAREIGDPAQMEAYWQTEAQRIRGQYVDGASMRNRERIGRGFDRLAMQYTFNVGESALSARQSQAEADWLAYQHEVVQQAGTVDPATRDVLIQQGEERIDALIANGTITAEEGQRRKLDLAGSSENAAAISQLSSDPAGFIVSLDAGTYGGLDGETQARYRARAEADLAAAAAAEEKAVEHARAEREKAIGTRLGQITDIFQAGREPVDIAFLDDPEVQAHPDYARAMAAQALHRETPLLAQMSVADLDAQIAVEEKKPITLKYQAERLEVLRELREQAATGYASDAMGTAKTVGMTVVDLPDFDPSNPGPYMQAVSSRLTTSERMVREGKVSGNVVFTADERAVLKTSMGPTGDPEARASWLMSLHAVAKDDVTRIARQATGDDTMVYAAELLTDGADPNVVRSILAGQRRVADKTVVLPPRDDFIAAYDAETQNEFRDQFDLAPQLIDAAAYLYAEAGGDPDRIDGKLYARSVQEALGAKPDVNGDYTIGGLQEFDTVGTRGNDNYYVPLPVGVPRDVVQAAIEATYDDLRGQLERKRDAAGQVQGIGRAAPDQSILAKVSLTGAPPDLGEPESWADAFGALRLAAYWEGGRPTGQFMMYRPDANGQPVMLYDTQGRVFRFRLEDLVKGVAR